jgi:hypothetical protein
MVDSALGVAREMARNPPDLSSPEMNKLLGQVEKYSSSGDGMLITINPTISTANQSATRVLGQMQATVNDT